MKRFCLAILTTTVVLLSLCPPVQAQYRYQRYQQPGYRPAQPQSFRPQRVYNPQPTYRLQPVYRPAPTAPAPVDRSRIPTQTGQLTAGYPALPTPEPNANDLSRQNFKNPSLDLLRRLGEQKPALSSDKPYSKFPRLSGEFEPQRVMLLSTGDLMPQHYHVLKELITKTSGHLPLVILVNDKKQLKTAVEIAESSGANLNHISFFVFQLDTIWLRDFGPRFLETESDPQSIDFYYDGTRPKDDQFPNKWGELAGIKNTTVEWTLQGGNLISNGQGLALTSTRFFEDNHVRFPFRDRPGNVEYERRKLVVDAFKTECNIDRLLFLKPLTPEATKHVDMLTTFLAADHMLVARVDPRIDPVNARILDENARFLQTVQVDGRPMKVDRIDIPPRQDKYWSPYTNVIFANDLVLVPVYKTDSPALVSRAIQTYRRLLPGKHVDTIDMTSMQKLEGALHCLSINVPEFVKIPAGTLTTQEARQVISGSREISKPKRLLVNKNVRDNKPKQQTKKPTDKPSRHTQPKPEPDPVMIAGEIITGDSDAASQKSSNQSKPTDKTAISNSDQRTAADTYRRVFVSQDGRFSLDAYAVALSRGKVYLLRKTDRTIITVDTGQLSQQDQNWISKNTSSIRKNGQLVRKFVDSGQN